MTTLETELVWIDGEDKPRGLCWCGCATPTRLATSTRPHWHLYKGLPVRYVLGHHLRIPLRERFEARVVQSDPGECWLWLGSVDRAGYGHLSLAPTPNKKTSIPAHRLSYELLVGPIPVGLAIDHLCRVRACVNPSHLEAVTHAENNRRMQVAQRAIRLAASA